MATGDGLKNTKAIYAGVIGFIAPGAGVLLPQVMPGGDGVQSNEWLWALLLCVVFAAGGGYAVQRVENKPKAE